MKEIQQEHGLQSFTVGTWQRGLNVISSDVLNLLELLVTECIFWFYLISESVQGAVMSCLAD